MKQIFDRILCIFLVCILISVFLTPLLISLLFASIDTNSSGIFVQSRIGKNAKNFTLYKLQTIHPKTRKISTIGKFLRRYKLDELPQLFNILNGTMSFVGPRPDIPGYADVLKGDDRVILKIRPGVTGLASLKYRNEEQILANQLNPLEYNDNIIWPDKVRINKWYAENQTFIIDVKILFHTIIPKPINIDQFIKKNSKI